MEIIRTILYWTIYVIVGGFVTLAFISALCGAVRCLYKNIKINGWNPSNWDLIYNMFEGTTKISE